MDVEGTASSGPHSPSLMTMLVPPESLGLELVLRNGITRAGWLTLHGPDLLIFEEGFPCVRWDWDLWPWPGEFYAGLVGVGLEGVWQGAGGHPLPPRLAPPNPPVVTEVRPDEVTVPMAVRPGKHGGRWDVRLLREGSERALAELQPVGPSTAQWRWQLGGRTGAAELHWGDRLGFFQRA